MINYSCNRIHRMELLVTMWFYYFLEKMYVIPHMPIWLYNYHLLISHTES